jgi:hypothetical protein
MITRAKNKKSQFLVLVFLIIFSSAGIGAGVAGQPLDNGPYVSRSNVMEPTVDSSFWGDREPMLGEPGMIVPPQDISVRLAQKPGLPTGNQGSSTDYLGLAIKLVNHPLYQEGRSSFFLDDNMLIQLSSMKFAATKEYYARTDIQSSWVTDFYTAANASDYDNVTLLLAELQPEK